MKRGTPDHPKTLHLAQLLDVSRFTAVGLLEILWHWSAKYAPQGDIGRWTDAKIAAGIGWDGDGAVLVRALLESGWIDAHAKHRLVIHDWHEHADQGVRKYLGRQKLKFLSFLKRRPDSVRTVSGPPLPLPRPLPLPLPRPEPTSLAATPEGSPGSPADPERPADPESPNAVREAQEACLRELNDAMKATGHPGDVLLTKASRTPGGDTITNIRNCSRVRWLEVTTDRLRSIRLGAAADAGNGLGSPARKGTAEQQTMTAAARVVERHQKRKAGAQ